MGFFSGLLVLNCHCPRLAQRSVIDSSLLKIEAVIEFQCINVHYQLMLYWGGEGHCFWTVFDLLALQLPYIVSTSRMTTSTSPICCSLCFTAIQAPIWFQFTFNLCRVLHNYIRSTKYLVFVDYHSNVNLNFLPSFRTNYTFSPISKIQPALQIILVISVCFNYADFSISCCFYAEFIGKLSTIIDRQTIAI